MQACRERQWGSRDHVGEFDGSGAWRVFQEQADRNKGNGYRLGRTYGHGRKLEFRIPRDRFGTFHPKILAILKDQEEECERLAGSLYTKGLTQSQVGQVFNDIYGEHYSKTSISRMIEYVRRDVSEWLERGLDANYPIVFVDCVHIKVFRKKRAATEAFYVILGVNEDATREVLGLYNSPIESASAGATCSMTFVIGAWSASA